MNFFEAEVKTSGEGTALRAGDVRLDLPPPKAAVAAAAQGGKVVAGIRPEDLKAVGDPVPGKTLRCVVEVVEPIGNETYVNVDAGGITLIAAVGRKTRVKAHTPMVLEPAFANLHLFDAQSGKSLG
jgi:multiple sugar transport system ATP-binding protein